MRTYIKIPFSPRARANNATGTFVLEMTRPALATRRVRRYRRAWRHVRGPQRPSGCTDDHVRSSAGHAGEARRDSGARRLDAMMAGPLPISGCFQQITRICLPSPLSGQPPAPRLLHRRLPAPGSTGVASPTTRSSRARSTTLKKRPTACAIRCHASIWCCTSSRRAATTWPR